MECPAGHKAPPYIVHRTIVSYHRGGFPHLPACRSLNPLRYRGYIYDTETGLYYLQSRYYDPEIGRWINADDVAASAGGHTNGYNLFAYCLNKPVNLDDPNGHWPQWLKNSVKWVTEKVFKPVVKAVQKN